MTATMTATVQRRLESIYRRVVFIVFCVTAWFAIPGTFWPHAVLDVLHIPVPRELVWAAFAFQLAFLVSMYTLPVLLDWRRYIFNAVLGGNCSHRFGHVLVDRLSPANRSIGGWHGLWRTHYGRSDSWIAVTHLVLRCYASSKFRGRESSMKSLPPKSAERLRTLCLRAGYLLLIVVALLGIVVWEKFYHEYPQQLPENDALAEFKYGSIGTEEAGGVPYWIWQILPQVFPEHLPGPGGYASLGMVWEAGSEMPVGFTKRRIGYDRVGINCAACHTGSYRLETPAGSSVTEVVAGAPATRLDVQGYLHFLSACAQDPRFNADNILGAIAYNHKLSALDKALYRYLLIPGTKKALQQQAEGARWQLSRPPWGAGRIDPFNPVKFGMLKMNPAADPTVGNSDMMLSGK